MDQTAVSTNLPVLNQAVKQSKGLSPADIKMVAVEALKSAIIDYRDSLSVEDLESAILQFVHREQVKQGDVQ